MTKERPNNNTGPATEIVCRDCGRAHHRHELARGEAAHCSQCGATLYEHRPPTVDRALALTLGGLFLFIVANVYPFLGMRMGGTVLHTTLLSGSIELYNQGKWELAALVSFTSIIAPGLQLGGLLYVLLLIRLGRVPRDLARVFRLVDNAPPGACAARFHAVDLCFGLGSIQPK